MPLYDYKCTKCARIAEVRHGFDQTHDEPCPDCGAPMTRVFNPPPIHFKGSGFYVTDSKTSSAPAKSAPESTSGESKSAPSVPEAKPSPSTSSESAA